MWEAMQIVRIGQTMDIKYLPRICCFFACLLLGAQSIHASPVVERLGHYSNQKSSLISGDPHIEGYSLNLYRQGKIVFGRFCWATGVEVPCVPIQNAVINSQRMLAFQAQISIGTEISKETGPQGRPAYRLITFRGKVANKLISGVVSKKNAYTPLTLAETERVKLLRVPNEENPISSYQEWASDPLNKPVVW